MVAKIGTEVKPGGFYSRPVKRWGTGTIKALKEGWSLYGGTGSQRELCKWALGRAHKRGLIKY